MDTNIEADWEKMAFEFDLNGYLILRDVLNEETTDRLNAVVEEKHLTKAGPKFMFIEEDALFYELIFHPLAMRLCSEWIDPHFRFDHAWGVHYPPSFRGAQENLHAGPYQNQGFFQYGWYNNKPRASCILFSYVLKDQPSGEGGLVLLPGSHKLNYPIGRHAAVDIFDRFYGKDFGTIPTLHCPVLQKGDLLIMSEATVHGTAAWKSEKAWRRNLYYKYCYGFMGWVPHDDPASQRLRERAATDLQRRVLARPFVSETSGNGQHWRPTTVGPVVAT